MKQMKQRSKGYCLKLVTTEIEIILISVEATKVLWYASLSFQFYLIPPNSKAS